jgi:hypothetical protein
MFEQAVTGPVVGLLDIYVADLCAKPEEPLWAD